MARRVTNKTGFSGLSGAGRVATTTKKNKTSKSVESNGNVPAILDTNPVETAGALGSIKNGAFILDFFFTTSMVLTVPKTGTVALGSGAAGFIPYWSDTNTLGQSNLKMTGSNVLSLLASATATLTVPRTGVCSTDTVSALTPGANVAMNCSLANRFTLTPGEDEAITPSGGYAGQTVTLEIVTSGATSYTLTFASPFKSAGTLATGTSTAKKFIVEFYNDGTDFIETRRTAAL